MRERRTVKFYMSREPGGTTAAVALDSGGRVTNLIRGRQYAEVFRAARKHWPHAKVVVRESVYYGRDGLYRVRTSRLTRHARTR